MKIGRLVSALALAVAAFPGCGDDQGASPATATATAVHTSTSAATSTPTAVPTSSPTARPTATSTPIPRTATATATAAVDDTPTSAPPTATMVASTSGRCTEAVACNPTSFSTVRSQDSCCDLASSLPLLPFSWCPESAIDEQTGECSQCVAHPCQGLPTRTPTPSATVEATATSSPTSSLAEVQMRAVIEFAATSCPSPDATGPHLMIGCGTTGCAFDCDYFSGHGGSAGLQLFATTSEASLAFDALVGEHALVEFHGLLASLWAAEFPYAGVPDGSSHHGGFVSGCWLAYAHAYDDTHFLLGPQPSQTLELIHQRGTEIGLFAACGDAP